MRIASFALAAALGLALPAAGFAQHEVNASLGISIPRGALDENTDTGWGFAGSYFYALTPKREVGIGVTGSFLNYGSTTRRVPLSTTIPDIRVDVTTSNNMGFLQPAIQLRVPSGAVQPYLVGSAGLAWFQTTTTLKDTRFNQDVLSDTNQSDATWVWGAGGGLQFHVYTGKEPGGISAMRLGARAREPMRVYVDVGARYLRGGEVDYLKKGSLVTPDGQFDPQENLVRSDIELVQIQIGATFTF